jgi:hypothetical protein
VSRCFPESSQLRSWPTSPWRPGHKDRAVVDFV